MEFDLVNNFVYNDWVTRHVIFSRQELWEMECLKNVIMRDEMWRKFEKYKMWRTIFEKFIKVEIVVAQELHTGRLTKKPAVWRVTTHRLRKRVKVVRFVSESKIENGTNCK